jgi:hypothetical protein
VTVKYLIINYVKFAYVLSDKTAPLNGDSIRSKYAENIANSVQPDIMS